ncbi:MAG: branched-chain amino acid ABC transporter permease [Firmicutes bacterium]|nr:branched-chain amino acid ABC transporter permease [Bacillota bacterium]MBQ6607242.1 branched-chain amino acid ABC transporter permease [Bacillota bacterium]MBR0179964.1 branched-chain amino acid ABC transporter permease [Bacillota bacterium]MBR3391783.1 branched-chain amino acid ABC transporter permease [Bacillota bacterium]
MIGQIIINGLLNGCVYALVAVGLSLTWGVMDIVNFAHGEFLLWGLYASFWIWALLGLDPLISMPIVIVLIFLLGVLTYLVVIKRVLKVSGLTALLATFGLSMVLKNLTQFFWTANYRNVTNTLVSNRSFKLLGMYIRQDYVVAAAGALIITLLVTLFLNRTKTGIAIKATSINKSAAQLVGIDTNRIYAITFGLSGACVGAAAALMASFTPIYPEACALYSTLAFVIVALGGFGNIKGALFAGLLVGVVEALGGYFIGTSFKYLVVFLLYLVVMQIRPRGLFGW